MNLPSEPFIQWLDGIYAKHKLSRVDAKLLTNDFYFVGGVRCSRQTFQIPNTAGLAALIGVSQKRLRQYAVCDRVSGRIRPRTREIPLTFIDRACTYYGHEHYLNIYDVADVDRDYQHSSKEPHCTQCGYELRKPAELCGFCEEERLGLNAF